MDSNSTSPKYDLAIVERAIFEVAAELHPKHVTIRELLLKIVGDPDDNREVGTASHAIRGLRESGLLRDRDDELAELTPTALHAYALLVA